MFTDPVFRTALGISLVLHAAVVMPHSFFSLPSEAAHVRTVDLNYILIEQPHLTDGEEVIVDGAAPETEGSEAASYEKTASVRVAAVQVTEASLEGTARLETSVKFSDSERQEALLKYYNLIREKIRARTHPAFGKGGKRGAVTLKFTLDPRGRLRKIDSVNGSNQGLANPWLEQKAVTGLRLAQPFPPLPEEMGAGPVSFLITVKFAN